MTQGPLTTDTLPRQLANLRDLGGIPLDGGGTTAPGVLYRSDAPFEGDDDPTHVPIWPPAVVIDLRSEHEAAGRHALAARSNIKPVPLTSSAAVIAVEQDHQAVRTMSAAEFRLDDVYRGILDVAADQVASTIGIVARADGPVLIHCSAGKDRTGIVVAILLLLAEVSEQSVIDDYQASTPRMIPLLNRLVDLGKQPRVLNANDASSLATPPERIRIAIDHVTGHPGGVKGWAVDHGASEDDISQWRRRFVPNSSPTEGTLR